MNFVCSCGENHTESIFRLIIFFSYLAGLVTVLFLYPDFIMSMDKTPDTFVLYCVFAASVLIFSSSVFGLFLLPLTACFYGAAACEMSLKFIGSYMSCGTADWKALLAAAIEFPAFFIAAVNGMCTSGLLLGSLKVSGPAFKSACIRKYLPVTLAAIAAAAAVCLIKG